MKVYHDRLSNITWSADNEDTDYPASNAGKSKVARPYRTEDVASEYTLTATFDAATYVDAVIIQGINAASVDVSLDGGAATNHVPKIDGLNRYRLHLLIEETITTLAMTLKGTPQDGRGVYEVQAVHPFGSGYEAPVSWNYGLRLIKILGKRQIGFDNRKTALYTVGQPFIRLEGRIGQEGTEDSEKLIRLATDEVVGLYFQTGPNKEVAVPVRMVDEQYSVTEEAYNQHPVDVALEENTS